MAKDQVAVQLCNYLNDMLRNRSYSDIQFVHSKISRSLFEVAINGGEPRYSLFYSLRGIAYSDFQIVPDYGKNPELDDDIESCYFSGNLEWAAGERKRFIEMMNNAFPGKCSKMEVFIVNVKGTF